MTSLDELAAAYPQTWVARCVKCDELQPMLFDTEAKRSWWIHDHQLANLDHDRYQLVNPDGLRQECTYGLGLSIVHPERIKADAATLGAGEAIRLRSLTIAQAGEEGWSIKPAHYHPETGVHQSMAWVHLEWGLGPLDVSPAQYRELQATGEYRWWHGEHDNNGPSWTGPGHNSDEAGAWSFSTREIYEFIDVELPYNERFRTLRYELRIHHGGQNLGVIALSSERWYALAELALLTARRAAAAGL